jgi:CubicO group peptidase (beta-lactamase class C family)
VRWEWKAPETLYTRRYVTWPLEEVKSLRLTLSIEYFEGFVHHHPVFRPHSTPIYSNTAFRILSYALEEIIGDSFDNIIEECVFKPLVLNHSGMHKPADNSGVIPQGDSMWSYDIGDEGP